MAFLRTNLFGKKQSPIFSVVAKNTDLITVLNRMDQLKHQIRIIFSLFTKKNSEKNL